MLGLVSYNSDDEEEEQQEQAEAQSLHTKIAEVTKDVMKDDRSLLEVNISHFLELRHKWVSSFDMAECASRYHFEVKNEIAFGL